MTLPGSFDDGLFSATLSKTCSSSMSESGVVLVDVERRMVPWTSSAFNTFTLISSPTLTVWLGSMSDTWRSADFRMFSSFGAWTCTTQPKFLTLVTVAVIKSPEAMTSLNPRSASSSCLFVKLSLFWAESTSTTRTFRASPTSNFVSRFAIWLTCNKPGLFSLPDGEVTDNMTPITSPLASTGLCTTASSQVVFDTSLNSSVLLTGSMDNLRRFAAASTPRTRT
mmetsp:Transcript_39283/g.71493  ORF Transcript_39283/g.71493 Transcript_39283/m.71493 type:complete len:224 (+) Transcript_39283:261-932(+)